MREGVTNPRRILVASLDWPQTAYLVAALHDAGHQVTLVTTGRHDALGLARYCEQVRSPAPEAPHYGEFLRAAIFRCGAELVLPVSEPVMERLWEMDPPCAVAIYPDLAPHQRALMRDRRRLYERAVTIGVPVAPWVPLANAAALDGAIAALGLPLVLRGTQGRGGTQVRIVATRAEAARALEFLFRHSPGEPFAQRFIDGDCCLIGGVLERGEMLRYFAHELIEAHPPLTGPSIRIRSLRDETLTACARSLFRDLASEGIACAEFMRDRRGAYTLIEVNPRPWGSIEAARRCGVDLCKVFAERLAGAPLTGPADYEPGVECVLFPRFLVARWASGAHLTLRDLRHAGRSVGSVPWRHPGLALHLLRRAYRELTGERPLG